MFVVHLRGFYLKLKLILIDKLMINSTFLLIPFIRSANGSISSLSGIVYTRIPTLSEGKKVLVNQRNRIN